MPAFFASAARLLRRGPFAAPFRKWAGQIVRQRRRRRGGAGRLKLCLSQILNRIEGGSPQACAAQFVTKESGADQDGSGETGAAEIGALKPGM